MKRIAVSLLVGALFACHADQMLPPLPSAMIRDAGHNGGNFYFAFLQPMVSQPTRNGVFDATQSPSVKVALLSGDASCTDPHLTYTMSTGPGGDASETVRVNATDGNYIVNLHTDKVAVRDGCTYRIRVFIGSIELGLADIELFLTQREAKNRTTNETVALVDGKTLPIKFWIAQGVLRDVGQGTASPEHETVIVTQNLKAGVLIPAGAVSVSTTILIESIDDRPCFPGLVGQKFEGLPGATDNSCYHFRTDPPLPDGKFNSPVVVGICVDLSQVSEEQRPKIQIFQFDAADLRLPDRIKALPNAAAPFLRCGELGIGLGKRGILDFAAHLFTSLFAPKPLLARSRAVVFDIGAGGSTDGFSLFTWGLVTDMATNTGDLQTAAIGTAVAIPPSVIFTDSTGAPIDSVPVTFTPETESGTVTGASTKSGRGGVSGVAQVGSWTLGSAGTNTLVASAPAFSGVMPTSVRFTATGITLALNFGAVGVGAAHSCALTTGGNAYCWGVNSEGGHPLGQLGTFVTLSTCYSFDCNVEPFPVNGTQTFASITGGAHHTCALTSAGAPYCWGRGNTGQLGNGGTDSSATPVATSTSRVFTSISAGGLFDGHTCGVSTDTIWCWGANSSGQLGNNTTTTLLTPDNVASGFKTVSAGTAHTCAVAGNGNAFCWGNNGSGQLGNGTTRSLTPVLVQGGHTWMSVSAADSHTCGVTTNHEVYCWGRNDLGQLGRGTLSVRDTLPMIVASTLLFRWVEASGFFTCALTDSDDAYCWGRNDFGELGDGTRTGDACNIGVQTVCRTTPQAVVGGHKFQAISADGAGDHTCGITTAATGAKVYCWGRNSTGQLGNGGKEDAASSGTPVLVSKQ